MIKIEDIKKEYEQVLNQLSDPELISDWEKFDELSKKKKSLEEIIEKEKEIKNIESKIEENKAISTTQEDQELVSLAETELSQLQEREKTLKKELQEMLKTDGSKSYPAVIIEIRAGTGGDEAALFAKDLFRMYSKYADNQGWKKHLLDSHGTELGGFKEITFELKDNNAYSKMKYEAGVHRVQRIPDTEKSGRVHTSTATVAVLAKPKTTEFKIKTEDLKIDTFRSSGPGGQNVNRRETAIRITHIPTGIIVASQNERNQLQNKENAMSILSARILEKKEKEAQSSIKGKRKAQIGKAKRAEKIRTYNFPQNRVTDHRIKKSWHNIEKIIDGELEPIIKAMEKITI